MLLWMVFTYCNPSKPDSFNSPTHTTATETSNDSIYYKTFKTDKGYGYEVFTGSKKLIYQPVIPGEAGYAGFPKRQQAEATAELVISKLRQSIMPPTISPEEVTVILSRSYTEQN